MEKEQRKQEPTNPVEVNWLQELLGSGAHKVYRGRNIELDTEVACKIIPSREEEHARESFKLAGPVCSPYIEQPYLLFNCKDPDGAQVLVAVSKRLTNKTLEQEAQRLLEGCSLEDRVKFTVNVGEQMAAGAAALHAKQCAYADFKPRNLLYDAEMNRVILMDFESAKAISTRTSATDVAGTHGYHAPEELNGRQIARQDLAPADVYKMALCNLEIFDGKPVGNVPNEKIRRAIRRASPELGSLLEQMLQANPRARPTAAEVRDRLKGIKDGFVLTRQKLAVRASTVLWKRLTSGAIALTGAVIIAASLIVGRYQQAFEISEQLARSNGAALKQSILAEQTAEDEKTSAEGQRDQARSDAEVARVAREVAEGEKNEAQTRVRRVEAHLRPGGSSNISIDPPWGTAFALPDGALVKTSVSVLENSNQLFVDGCEMPMKDGCITLDVPIGKENLIEAVAPDGARTQGKLKFRSDLKPPEARFLVPERPQLTNKAGLHPFAIKITDRTVCILLIEHRVAGKVIGQLRVEPVPGGPPENGTSVDFEFDLQGEGEHVLGVTVLDEARNATVMISEPITLDVTAPVVTQTAPVSGDPLWSHRRFLFVGRVNEDLSSFTIDDKKINLEKGTFAIEVAPLTIQVIVHPVDLAGNGGAKTFAFERPCLVRATFNGALAAADGKTADEAWQIYKEARARCVEKGCPEADVAKVFGDKGAATKPPKYEDALRILTLPTWKESDEKTQDSVIAAVSVKWASEFRFLRVEKNDCGGQSFRIATFVHLKTGIEMNLVPAGTFLMGDEGKTVTIKAPFFLGCTEITQGQWFALAGSNPSHFNQGPEAPNRPAESFSWEAAKSTLEKAGLRLPTEAEWEYACRAGTKTAWAPGDNEADLTLYAWFGDGSNGTTHPVATKKPNAFGLYDMHGNVWEWSEDSYTVGNRVYRGGCLWYSSSLARSAGRLGGAPGCSNWNLGCRAAKGL